MPAQLSGVKAIDATFYYSLALKNDGTVVAWGDASNAVTQVPAALTGVTAIAAGGFHALALKADGTVVAWGALNLSADSPTRIPAGLRDVVAVAAEFDYSLALKKDGTVVAWGNNGSGQTNVPPGLSQVTAIAAASGHAIALKSDGTVVGWGGEGTFRPYGEQIPPQGLTQVKAISAGGQRSLAIGFPMIGLPQFETFRYGFYHVYSISLEELTATSATLHATINPHSTDTAVRFQIGIAPNYDTTIDAIPLTVTGNLPIQVTAKVTGLLPDKNYTFRAVASNAVGGSTVTSSFTTLKIVPTAVDDLAVTTGKPMTIMPLANDLDPSNTGLAIAGFTQGSHGSVSFSASVS